MVAGLLLAIPGAIVERAFSFPDLRRALYELPGFCCLASSSPIDTSTSAAVILSIRAI
jgi:hypothetical protein